MKIISLLVIIFAISFTSHAKNEKKNNDPLQNILNECLAGNKVKGISAAVYLKDKGKITTHVAGVSHDDVPIKKTMLWGIGSNTKTYAAVLCMKLMDAGLLDIDKPISAYLPHFDNINMEVTTRNLLQHESGLTDFFASPEYNSVFDKNPSRRWKPEECIKYASIENEPEVEGHYTATNFVLAGMVIEAVTGKEFHVALREYITGPLKLKHTYVDGFDEIKEVKAHPWMGTSKDVYDEDRTEMSTAGWTAGCMMSIPSDMVKWYNELFNNHFISEAAFKEFTSFKPWSYDRFYQWVGLGIFKVERNGRTYYAHGGGAYGYFSFSLYDIETGNCIIAMTTGDFTEAENLSYKIAEHVCQ